MILHVGCKKFSKKLSVKNPNSGFEILGLEWTLITDEKV